MTNLNLSENEEELKWRRYNNMKIEGNQKELDAMVEFHKGNRVEGLRLYSQLNDFLNTCRKRKLPSVKTAVPFRLVCY